MICGLTSLSKSQATVLITTLEYILQNYSLGKKWTKDIGSMVTALNLYINSSSPEELKKEHFIYLIHYPDKSYGKSFFTSSITSRYFGRQRTYRAAKSYYERLIKRINKAYKIGMAQLAPDHSKTYPFIKESSESFPMFLVDEFNSYMTATEVEDRIRVGSVQIRYSLGGFSSFTTSCLITFTGTGLRNVALNFGGSFLSTLFRDWKHDRLDKYTTERIQPSKKKTYFLHLPNVKLKLNEKTNENLIEALGLLYKKYTEHLKNSNRRLNIQDHVQEFPDGYLIETIDYESFHLPVNKEIAIDGFYVHRFNRYQISINKESKKLSRAHAIISIQECDTRCIDLLWDLARTLKYRQSSSTMHQEQYYMFSNEGIWDFYQTREFVKDKLLPAITQNEQITSAP